MEQKGVDLSDSEKKLIEHARKGEIACYQSGDPQADQVANGRDWDDRREIRAEVISVLVVGANPNWPVHAKGVQIAGARIVGALDLTGAAIQCPLSLLYCYVEEEVILRDASIRSLRVYDSRLERGLNGESLKCSGSIYLKGRCEARGEVRLANADIKGNLDCDGARFECPDGYALNAQCFKIGGSVLLGQGFSAKGAVDLFGADIRGNLECAAGSFEKPDADGNGYALNADGIKVGGRVFLAQKFSAKGEVRLVGADVHGDLNCKASSFENHGGPALSADGIKVGGSIFLGWGVSTRREALRFTARGEVRLVDAEIGQDLDCVGGTFDNESGYALNADGVKVGGKVLLSCEFMPSGEAFNEFRAKGEVRLLEADIAGQLACLGTFENEKPCGDALTVRGARVGSTLFLRFPQRLKGRLDLAHAQVRELDDSSQSWPAEDNLLLDAFEYERFTGSAPRRAEERLVWLALQPKGKGDQLYPQFCPQPYEQLAKVLRVIGDETGVRKVLIKKRWELRKRGRLGLPAWLWNWFLYLTVGYGYRGWLPLVWAVVVVAAGAFLFQHATFQPTKSNAPAVPRALVETQEKPLAKSAESEQTPASTQPPVAPSLPTQGSKPVPVTEQPVGGVMPTQPARHLEHPVLYSIDVFLPFADLNQKKTWLLDESQTYFWGYEVCYLIEFLAGWILTALVATAATGLMKKE